ncbi:MBOAT family protein [bacterium]|nr:MBOAT family protein [bacterium]
MLFNSYVFWLFYAIVLLLYFRLQHRFQNRLLLVASYIFYGYWDYRFLSLILISTVVDYYVAQAIHASDRQSRRKRLLLVSIVVNIGFLGFFKYYNFFAEELQAVLLPIWPSISLQLLHIILPVGISFYTFQTLSYTIDAYYKKIEPARNFIDFALFVSFFPQLVAGPIERAGRLLPQVSSHRTVTREDFNQGLFLVVSGLFKKVVIADNMAVIVNTVFSKPVAEMSGAEVVVGLYAFAFQIYGDFSGYSSIAKGVAKWLGFELMWNFRNPYFAVSPSDFWRRWHISLSTWLRDYLYIPLGGNRFGSLLTFRNLVITMFLGGLWHGANWTFIVWGLFHGVLLIVYHVRDQVFGRDRLESEKNPLKRAFSVVTMFHLICLSWLFFRAESIGQAGQMLATIVTVPIWTPFATYALLSLIFFVAPLLLFEFWTERKGDLYALISANGAVQACCYLYMILMLVIFPPLRAQTFIYFQF